MNCPNCKTPNSRVTKTKAYNGSLKVRMRKCPRCNARFRTYEILENDVPKEDRLEGFDCS